MTIFSIFLNCKDVRSDTVASDTPGDVHLFPDSTTVFPRGTFRVGSNAGKFDEHCTTYHVGNNTKTNKERHTRHRHSWLPICCSVLPTQIQTHSQQRFFHLSLHLSTKDNSFFRIVLPIPRPHSNNKYSNGFQVNSDFRKRGISSSAA